MTAPLSACTLNGARVLNANILRPVRGAWTALLRVDSQTAPKRGDAATVLFTGETGSLALQGVVGVGGLYVDVLFVRVMGGLVAPGTGTIGLDVRVPAKSYRGMPVRVILADLLAAGGLTLSQTSDATSLGRFLPSYARSSGSVGQGLDALAVELGIGWRVLEDGTIRIGSPTWAASALVDGFDVTMEDPANDTVEIAADIPAVIPGTTFRGRRVVSVTDSVESGKARTLVRYG